MEPYLEYVDFQKTFENSEIAEDYLVKTLREIEGVEEIKITQKGIGIKFNRYLISRSGIIKVMKELGFSIVSDNKKTGRFGSFINKLAKSNKKSFGNQKLDCCDLNKH